jgi:hypothetical protein
MRSFYHSPAICFLFLATPFSFPHTTFSPFLCNCFSSLTTPFSFPHTTFSPVSGHFCPLFRPPYSPFPCLLFLLLPSHSSVPASIYLYHRNYIYSAKKVLQISSFFRRGCKCGAANVACISCRPQVS